MLRNKLNEFWNDYDLLLSKKRKKTSINTFQPVCVKVEYPEIVLPAAKTYPFLDGGERETKNGKKKKRRKKNHVDRLTCPQVCAHAENRYAKGNWKRHARGPLVVSLSFFFFSLEERKEARHPPPSPLLSPVLFFSARKGKHFCTQPEHVGVRR